MGVCSEFTVHIKIKPGHADALREDAANISRHCINHWNGNAKPVEWTATADEILAKVRIVQSTVKKLVDNNAKETKRAVRDIRRREYPCELQLI